MNSFSNAFISQIVCLITLLAQHTATVELLRNRSDSYMYHIGAITTCIYVTIVVSINLLRL